MNQDRPTLAIYGIQDRDNYTHPFNVHDHNLIIMQNGKVRDFLQFEQTTGHKRDNHLHKQFYTILKK